jgi:cardiolipin synthase
MTIEGKQDRGNGVKRAVFAGIAIAIQIVAIFILYFSIGREYAWVAHVLMLVAIILVLYIYAKHTTASMKMPWLILITGFPFFRSFPLPSYWIKQRYKEDEKALRGDK